MRKKLEAPHARDLQSDVAASRLAAAHRSDPLRIRDEVARSVCWDDLHRKRLHLVDEGIEDLARKGFVARGVRSLCRLHLVGETRAGSDTCNRSQKVGKLLVPQGAKDRPKWSSDERRR